MTRYAHWLAAGLLLQAAIRGGADPAAGALPREPAASSVASLNAMRVEKSPSIDGDLDDDAWRVAPPPAMRLRQYLPRQECPMTETTAIQVAYDRNNLYIAVRCSSSAPEGITSRCMQRDGNLGADDYVAIVLDTFHDHRQGYYFQINPNGARADALIGDGATLDFDWNGLWTARCRSGNQGWTAEIAVPFRTLSFDPGGAAWGFNLERHIARSSEYGRWQGARPGIPLQDLSAAGEITGLRDLQQGLGIEVTPYALIGDTRRTAEDGDQRTDAGGDLRYHMTPNLALTLSHNMDFAESEADDRVINFTRFPLFFPEKRAFFLEDSNLFGFAAPKGLIPFYSRRIGLSPEGAIVPISLAGKLAGRVQDFSVGILGAHLTSTTNQSSAAMALRLSRSFLDQSSVGIIVTDGNSGSAERNRLFGTDLRYRTSSLPGGNVGEITLFGLGTIAGDAGTMEPAYGAALRYPNDLINASLQFHEIAEGFQPGLGFVSRTGTRAYSGFCQWGPRPKAPGPVQQCLVSCSQDYYTDLSNRLESSALEVRPISLVFRSSDTLYAAVQHATDAPRDDFVIAEDTSLAAGEYSWNRVELGAEFANKRALSGRVAVSRGGFYSGRRETCSAAVDWRPGRRFGLRADYAFDHLDLAEGAADSHVASGRLQWNFTPDCAWANLVQYDSLSDGIGFNSRFQWEYRPGSILNLVLSQDYGDQDGSALRLRGSEVVLKVRVTVRF